VLAWASVRECHPTGLITPDSYCDHALLVNRELVIPFRVMARDRHLWTALTVGLFVGSAIWIALRPSWQSIIVGGGLIVLLAWQRVTMLVTRRVSGQRASSIGRDFRTDRFATGLEPPLGACALAFAGLGSLTQSPRSRALRLRHRHSVAALSGLLLC
jgi:hypothetical protein